MAGRSYERPPMPDDLRRNIIAEGPGPGQIPLPRVQAGPPQPLPPRKFAGPRMSDKMAEERGWLFAPNPGPGEWGPMDWKGMIERMRDEEEISGFPLSNEEYGDILSGEPHYYPRGS